MKKIEILTDMDKWACSQARLVYNVNLAKYPSGHFQLSNCFDFFSILSHIGSPLASKQKDTEARIPYIYIVPLQKVLGQICDILGKAKAANEALDAKNFFPLAKRHPRQIGFNF